MITTVVFFGILFGLMVIYVFIGKDRFRRHRFFLSFISALIFVQIHSFLVRSGLMVHTLFLMNSNIPVMLLFGPLTYFYTKELSDDRRISRSSIVLHFLPFLFYFLYSFNFFLQEDGYKHMVLSTLTETDLVPSTYSKTFEADPWDIQGWVVVELISVHLMTYSIGSILNSNRWISGKGEIVKSRRRWLMFINTMLLTGGLVLLLSEGGVVNEVVLFTSPLSGFSGDLFGTIALYLTTFYLLTRPKFLFEHNRKYLKSSLPNEYKATKLDTILGCLEKDKPYLKSEFSLDLLSELTALSKHHISQIINEDLGCGFYDLTNQYRVEEAKRLLATTDVVKIEALAYHLGYKSKSSFFQAFKKSTGVTPAKYLELIVHQSFPVGSNSKTCS